VLKIRHYAKPQNVVCNPVGHILLLKNRTMTVRNKPTLRSQVLLQGTQGLTQSQPCKTTCMHLRSINTLLFLTMALWTVRINAQPNVPRPKFQNYQPVNLPTHEINSGTQAYFQDKILNNPLLPNNDPSVQAQNLRIMQQSGMTLPGQTSNIRQQQINELKQELEADKRDVYKATINRFQSYLNQFLQLNPDNFSITQAVYLSEAVYYDKPYSYEEFEKAIKQRAGFVKQILKQEGLSIKNGSAVHYGIQKLFSQDNTIKDNKTGKEILLKRIEYDFDDFYGEKDWTKMFVTKVLQTNSGQCHNLPLLYLCLAEQLNAKAYLSLAPNHSFIQFPDSKNRLHNFETTNGNLVSTQWLMQSDAISATAYKNKTYLDTLSSRKLYAQCLADFQMAYLMKNGYDNYSQQLSNQILAIDSTNINALMTNSNYATYLFQDLLKRAGFPPKEKFTEYPELQSTYNNMMAAQQKVNERGYQDMPEQQYKDWLKSIEAEKQKQRHKEEQQRLKREIEQLKKMKSTFINSPKG
jgi:hypothetical protein